MRDLLRESEPSNFEDLIALVALFRPGPMENIPKYISCKHGREKPEFLHETIEPVVKDTYGVIIYQEQVMQIAQVFAGFSLGQADLLRRAMGKKIKAEMAAQRDDFVEGAMARGVDRARAVYVFDLVDKFAGYGFNKAHSTGYALVAYQTAWLKANYPNEYLAASMSLDLNNTDKLGLFRQELIRIGVALMPPDVNQSGAAFSVDYEREGHPVRYALAAIKNIGRAAAEAIVTERERGGPYGNLMEFAGRIDSGHVNKRQLENLAAAGAFDSMNENRAAVSAAAETILSFAASVAAERASQQVNLFGDAIADTGADIQLPAVEPWSDSVLLEREFGAVGFHLSGHPVEGFAASLERLGVVTAAELPKRLNGSTRKFKLAGFVHHVREKTSARGNRYAFVHLSDPTGNFEIVVFSEQLAAHRELLVAGALLLVGVEGRTEDGQARLAVQSVVLLAAAVAAASPGLEIFLGDSRGGEDTLAALKSSLDNAKRGGGRVSVRLHLDAQHREVEIELPDGFVLSAQVKDAIGRIPGVSRVREL
jgi:DNA polymerase-3 subunit alpha